MNELRYHVVKVPKDTSRPSELLAAFREKQEAMFWGIKNHLQDSRYNLRLIEQRIL